ncbi:hypothetical protein CEUSTIGMA_g9019.t1 [Chlamydomonas eustigma]|uniref:Transmembrane protein n=1 Tax=Chlamydomonas eustigma TaxID=1157962 RepID=A0A250XEV5_9CHLO|nr:hypothetical protein CEUSTIGMA_g9019.t1 [Chlamydomonas eustigma]|eukprot:GAX81591.1 hypothetical protein CEUSTIGMA_g9019.t1 [Chlamydomonas eustigma]
MDKQDTVLFVGKCVNRSGPAVSNSIVTISNNVPSRVFAETQQVMSLNPTQRYCGEIQPASMEPSECSFSTAVLETDMEEEPIHDDLKLKQDDSQLQLCFSHNSNPQQDTVATFQPMTLQGQKEDSSFCIEIQSAEDPLSGHAVQEDLSDLDGCNKGLVHSHGFTIWQQFSILLDFGILAYLAELAFSFLLHVMLLIMFGWEISIDLYLSRLLTLPGFKAFLFQTAAQNGVHGSPGVGTETFIIIWHVALQLMAGLVLLLIPVGRLVTAGLSSRSQSAKHQEEDTLAADDISQLNQPPPSSTPPGGWHLQWWLLVMLLVAQWPKLPALASLLNKLQGVDAWCATSSMSQTSPSIISSSQLPASSSPGFLAPLLLSPFQDAFNPASLSHLGTPFHASWGLSGMLLQGPTIAAISSPPTPSGSSTIDEPQCLDLNFGFVVQATTFLCILNGALMLLRVLSSTVFPFGIWAWPLSCLLLLWRPITSAATLAAVQQHATSQGWLEDSSLTHLAVANVVMALLVSFFGATLGTLLLLPGARTWFRSLLPAKERLQGVMVPFEDEGLNPLSSSLRMRAGRKGQVQPTMVALNESTFKGVMSQQQADEIIVYPTAATAGQFQKDNMDIHDGGAASPTVPQSCTAVVEPDSTWSSPSEGMSADIPLRAKSGAPEKKGLKDDVSAFADEEATGMKKTVVYDKAAIITANGYPSSGPRRYREKYGVSRDSLPERDVDDEHRHNVLNAGALRHENDEVGGGRDAGSVMAAAAGMWLKDPTSTASAVSGLPVMCGAVAVSALNDGEVHAGSDSEVSDICVDEVDESRDAADSESSSAKFQLHVEVTNESAQGRVVYLPVKRKTATLLAESCLTSAWGSFTAASATRMTHEAALMDSEAAVIVPNSAITAAEAEGTAGAPVFHSCHDEDALMPFIYDEAETRVESGSCKEPNDNDIVLLLQKRPSEAAAVVSCRVDGMKSFAGSSVGGHSVALMRPQQQKMNDGWGGGAVNVDKCQSQHNSSQQFSYDVGLFSRPHQEAPPGPGLRKGLWTMDSPAKAGHHDSLLSNVAGGSSRSGGLLPSVDDNSLTEIQVMVLEGLEDDESEVLHLGALGDLSAMSGSTQAAEGAAGGSRRKRWGAERAQQLLPGLPQSVNGLPTGKCDSNARMMQGTRRDEHQSANLLPYGRHDDALGRGGGVGGHLHGLMETKLTVVQRGSVLPAVMQATFSAWASLSPPAATAATAATAANLLRTSQPPAAVITQQYTNTGRGGGSKLGVVEDCVVENFEDSSCDEVESYHQNKHLPRPPLPPALPAPAPPPPSMPLPSFNQETATDVNTSTMSPPHYTTAAASRRVTTGPAITTTTASLNILSQSSSSIYYNNYSSKEATTTSSKEATTTSITSLEANSVAMRESRTVATGSRTMLRSLRPGNWPSASSNRRSALPGLSAPRSLVTEEDHDLGTTVVAKKGVQPQGHLSTPKRRHHNNTAMMSTDYGAGLHDEHLYSVTMSEGGGEILHTIASAAVTNGGYPKEDDARSPLLLRHVETSSPASRRGGAAALLSSSNSPSRHYHNKDTSSSSPASKVIATARAFFAASPSRAGEATSSSGVFAASSSGIRSAATTFSPSRVAATLQRCTRRVLSRAIASVGGRVAATERLLHASAVPDRGSDMDYVMPAADSFHLEGNTTSGPANGERVTTSGPANGERVTTSGPANGERVTTSGPANGEGVTTSGPANGERVTTSGPANGERVTTLSGSANGERVTTSGPANGEGVTTSVPANGDYCVASPLRPSGIPSDSSHWRRHGQVVPSRPADMRDSRPQCLGSLTGDMRDSRPQCLGSLTGDMRDSRPQCLGSLTADMRDSRPQCLGSLTGDGLDSSDDEKEVDVGEVDGGEFARGSASNTALHVNEACVYADVTLDNRISSGRGGSFVPPAGVTKGVDYRTAPGLGEAAVRNGPAGSTVLFNKGANQDMQFGSSQI